MKVVALPSAKPVPATVTLVPPDAGPELGATLSTLGMYSKRSLVVSALVPLTLVTGTSTVPAAAGGEAALLEGAHPRRQLVPAWPPKRPVRAAAKSVAL